MNTRLAVLCLLSAAAVVVVACGKEPLPPVAKKDEPAKEAARPLPPSAPTAAPAEGEKK